MLYDTNYIITYSLDISRFYAMYDSHFSDIYAYDYIEI